MLYILLFLIKRTKIAENIFFYLLAAEAAFFIMASTLASSNLGLFMKSTQRRFCVERWGSCFRALSCLSQRPRESFTELSKLRIPVWRSRSFSPISGQGSEDRVGFLTASKNGESKKNNNGQFLASDKK